MNNILSFLHIGRGHWNAPADLRRKHIRHQGLHAEVVVGNRSYSIRDWSLGGVSFETAPDARLAVGDQLHLTLKFRFMHDTVTILQPAQIVRAARRGIAVKFAPLDKAGRRAFDRVLDGMNAESFFSSQAA